jgi:hypothetical protein
MAEKESKSPQILNAASNLVGFCLVIITSIRALNMGSVTLLDDITALATLLFIASVLFSFLAIRNSTRRPARYEVMAEISFLCGLLLLFFTILFITFNVIK